MIDYFIIALLLLEKISAKIRKIYEYMVWPEKSLSFFNSYDFFYIKRKKK